MISHQQTAYLDHSWIPQIHECCFASFVAIFLNLTESRTEVKARSKGRNYHQNMATVKEKNDIIITSILLRGSTELELQFLLSFAVLHIEFMTAKYVKPL